MKLNWGVSGSINENPQKADHLPLPCLTLVMGACCDQVRFQFVKLPCQKGREFEVSSLKMHPLRVFSSRLQPQQHNKPPQTSCNHHSHLLQLLTVANNTSTADSNLSTFKGRTPENAKGDPTFASRFRQGPNTPRQLPMFSCHRTISQTSGWAELSSWTTTTPTSDFCCPGTAEIDMASLNGTKKNKKQEQR